MTTNAGSSADGTPAGFTMTAHSADEVKVKAALEDFLRPRIHQPRRRHRRVQPPHARKTSASSAASCSTTSRPCWPKKERRLHLRRRGRGAAGRQGLFRKYGARHLRRLIQTDVEDAVASVIIEGLSERGHGRLAHRRKRRAQAREPLVRDGTRLSEKNRARVRASARSPRPPRANTRASSSPSEMQPYEVAEILGSDIDSGLTKSGVARTAQIRRQHHPGGAVAFLRPKPEEAASRHPRPAGAAVRGHSVHFHARPAVYAAGRLRGGGDAGQRLSGKPLAAGDQKHLRRASPEPSSSATAANSRWTAARSSRRRHPAGGRAHRPRGRAAHRIQRLTVLETPVTRAKSSVGKDASYIADGTRRRHRAEYGLRALGRHRRQRKAIVTATGRGTRPSACFRATARATRCRRCSNPSAARAGSFRWRRW